MFTRCPNNIFDVRLVVLFGALGYLFAKIGCEPAPMLLGFILGPMMEEFFRRALIISRGDFIVFVERPISAGLLAAALALLVSMSLPAIAKWRRASHRRAGRSCLSPLAGRGRGEAHAKVALRLPLTPTLSPLKRMGRGGECRPTPASGRGP